MRVTEDKYQRSDGYQAKQTSLAKKMMVLLLFLGQDDSGTDCNLFNGTWVKDFGGPTYNNITWPGA